MSRNDLEYSIEDFDAFLPQEPEAEAPKVQSNGSHRDRHGVVERAARYLAAIPPAIEGQNGDRHTYITCCKLVRDFGLSETEALNLLRPWNAACQPPWTERELQAKVQNALRYGDNPIGWKAAASGPRNQDDHQEPPRSDPNANGGASGADADSNEGDAIREEEATPTRYSEDALADLFSKTHEQGFVYVDQWGWLQYDGARYQRVPDVIVMGYARRICREQSECCKEDPEVDKRGRIGLARALASAKTVAAVVRLASSDKRHYARASEFDADLWAFNTPGGTVDLRTGELRAHQAKDRITKLAGATPKGDCPKWLAFLERVTDGNKELQAYLQRNAGYGMCGDPSEECIDFFYGTGGNGKGTYLKQLQNCFGEYATTAATETFLESKGERHPTDVAKLAGARLVVAQEVNQGQHWNESRLKTMTGRDELTARFMRRDLFNFVPQFTLIISGNHKPALKTVDDAWRRRFHLVPFNVSIPKEEQNPELKNELEAEADGILNWCLQGCLEWQRARLNPPEIVLAATADYLADEDTFTMWLDECCLRGHPGYEEASSLLYTSHQRWTEERGERPLGKKGFSQTLKQKKFKDRHVERGSVFYGIRLTDAERATAKAILQEKKRRAEGRDEHDG